jgi:23S rRNA (adenine-N6)-dimethyltransferase
MDKGAAKGFIEISLTKPRILTWGMGFDFSIGQTIAPENFSPSPRVDSVVFTMYRQKKPLIPFVHHQQFMAFASYGLRFPQLRVSDVLKNIFTPPQILRLLRSIQVDRYFRIGLLDEQQWATIFLTMIRYVEFYRWPKKRKSKF